MWSSIRKFFSSVVTWFTTPGNVGRIASELQRVQDTLLEPAIEVAEEIARLTPTRSDDEIVALIKRFNLDIFPEKSNAGIERTLFEAAKKQLLLRVPPGTPNRLLNIAVDVAAAIVWKPK